MEPNGNTTGTDTSIALEVMQELGLDPNGSSDLFGSGDAAPTTDADADDTVEASEDDTTVEAPVDDGFISKKRKGKSLEAAVALLDKAHAAPIKALQADYTRKSQELKRLQADHADASHRASVAEAHLATLQQRLESTLRKLGVTGASAIDVYGDGAEDAIRGLLGGMEAAISDTRAQAALREQEAAAKAAEASYEVWALKNADVLDNPTLSAELQALMVSNKSLDADTAVELIRLRNQRAASAHANARKQAERAAAKAAASKAAPTRRPPPEREPTQAELRKMSAQEIYRMVQASQK